ncbi:helix-turn-helix domain-containing protein [Pseudomonas chlororaphis]|nr:helix-turn-helix transcriptional regulator [Pseudomonas chlororaphis]
MSNVVLPGGIRTRRKVKSKGLRFSTLDAICQYLECQPGDLLIHEPEVE